MQPPVRQEQLDFKCSSRHQGCESDEKKKRANKKGTRESGIVGVQFTGCGGKTSEKRLELEEGGRRFKMTCAL